MSLLRCEIEGFLWFIDGYTAIIYRDFIYGYSSRIYTHTSILDIRKDMLLLLHSILISSIEDIVTIAIDGILVTFSRFTWTLIPVAVLALVGLHSLDRLYSTSRRTQWHEIFGLVVKVWAHQWYWSYEYSDTTSNRYDSYIKPQHSLNLGDYRLLEVDYRAIVPTAIDAILVVSSDDLLHSFTIPTISVKIDAIPGQLNTTHLLLLLPGLY